jgi:hypothetical protein
VDSLLLLLLGPVVMVLQAVPIQLIQELLLLVPWSNSSSCCNLVRELHRRDLHHSRQAQIITVIISSCLRRWQAQQDRQEQQQV